MTTAFEGCVTWSGGQVQQVDMAIDPLLESRNHASHYETQQVQVVVLGRVARDIGDAEYANDAAFVAQTFRDHGEQFPDKLNGEFAVAVFDRVAGDLHLTRDVAGTRPLYYALQAGVIWFATSVEAVCDAAKLDGVANDDALAHYLCYRPMAAGETLMQDVSIVRPGHRLTCSAPTLETTDAFPHHVALDYWRPQERLASSILSRSDAVQALSELITTVTTQLLRPDDVAGAHVTGGLDSAAVAAALSTATEGHATSPFGFAWQHDPTKQADPLADQERVHSIAASLGFPMHYCPATPTSVQLSLARDAIRQPPEMLLLEDPVLNVASELAVTVLFSGWGGDECVSYRGNNHFGSLLRSGKLIRLLSDARKADGSVVRRVAGTVKAMLLRSKSRTPPRGYAAEHLHQRVSKPVADIHGVIGNTEAQLAQLTNGHIAARAEAWSVAGAEAGLQHVYPLLDRRVLELALSLPSEYFAIPRRRILMYELIDQLAPPGFPAADKAEPSRGRDTFRAIHSLLADHGNTLPLRPESETWLDVSKLKRVIDELAEDPMDLPEPGRLIAALEVGFDETGVPLGELGNKNATG